MHRLTTTKTLIIGKNLDKKNSNNEQINNYKSLDYWEKINRLSDEKEMINEKKKITENKTWQMNLKNTNNEKYRSIIDKDNYLYTWLTIYWWIEDKSIDI